MDPSYLQDTVEKKLSQMILDKKFSGEWKQPWRSYLSSGGLLAWWPVGLRYTFSSSLTFGHLFGLLPWLPPQFPIQFHLLIFTSVLTFFTLVSISISSFGTFFGSLDLSTLLKHLTWKVSSFRLSLSLTLQVLRPHKTTAVWKQQICRHNLQHVKEFPLALINRFCIVTSGILPKFIWKMYC